MPPTSSAPGFRIPMKGTTSLVVGVAVVVVLLIAFPAYRWFFGISVGIGLGVAAALILWHKLRPIKEENVEHKRPLGLS